MDISAQYFVYKPPLRAKEQNIKYEKTIGECEP